MPSKDSTALKKLQKETVAEYRTTHPSRHSEKSSQASSHRSAMSDHGDDDVIASDDEEAQSVVADDAQSVASDDDAQPASEDRSRSASGSPAPTESKKPTAHDEEASEDNLEEEAQENPDEATKDNPDGDEEDSGDGSEGETEGNTTVGDSKAFGPNRPFQCPHCLKAWPKKSHLNRHHRQSRCATARKEAAAAAAGAANGGASGDMAAATAGGSVVGSNAGTSAVIPPAGQPAASEYETRMKEGKLRLVCPRCKGDFQDESTIKKHRLTSCNMCEGCVAAGGIAAEVLCDRKVNCNRCTAHAIPCVRPRKRGAAAPSPTTTLAPPVRAPKRVASRQASEAPSESGGQAKPAKAATTTAPKKAASKKTAGAKEADHDKQKGLAMIQEEDEPASSPVKKKAAVPAAKKASAKVKAKAIELHPQFSGKRLPTNTADAPMVDRDGDRQMRDAPEDVVEEERVDVQPRYADSDVRGDRPAKRSRLTEAAKEKTIASPPPYARSGAGSAEPTTPGNKRSRPDDENSWDALLQEKTDEAIRLEQLWETKKMELSVAERMWKVARNDLGQTVTAFREFRKPTTRRRKSSAAQQSPPSSPPQDEGTPEHSFDEDVEMSDAVEEGDQENLDPATKKLASEVGGYLKASKAGKAREFLKALTANSSTPTSPNAEMPTNSELDQTLEEDSLFAVGKATPLNASPVRAKSSSPPADGPETVMLIKYTNDTTTKWGNGEDTDVGLTDFATGHPTGAKPPTPEKPVAEDIAGAKALNQARKAAKAAQSSRARAPLRGARSQSVPLGSSGDIPKRSLRSARAGAGAGVKSVEGRSAAPVASPTGAGVKKRK